MRVSSILYSGIAVLAACLLGISSAITCTADPTVVGCIECSTAPNDVESLAGASSSNVDCYADPFSSECSADPPSQMAVSGRFPGKR